MHLQDQQQPAKIPKTDVEADVKTQVDTSPQPENKSEKIEKMEVEEEENTTKEETKAEKHTSEAVEQFENIVEDITGAEEVTDVFVSDAKPIITECTGTKMTVTEPQSGVVNSVSDSKSNGDKHASEESLVITEIKDITNDKESLSEGAEIIEDLVPVVEEPVAQDMEDLQNVGEVLDKECDEILSKVQDVTNLDNIPLKSLHPIAEEETMEKEDMDTNDIVERILDKEQELEMKKCEMDLNSVQNISATKPTTGTDKSEVFQVTDKPSEVLEPKEKPLETIVEEAKADEVKEKHVDVKSTTEETVKGNSLLEEKVKENKITQEKVKESNVTVEKVKDSGTEEKIKEISVPEEELMETVVPEENVTETNVTEDKVEEITANKAKETTTTVTEEKVKETIVPEEKIKEVSATETEVKEASVTEEKVEKAILAEEKVKENNSTEDELKKTILQKKNDEIEQKVNEPTEDEAKEKKESDLSDDIAMNSCDTDGKVKDNSITEKKVKEETLEQCSIIKKDVSVVEQKVEDGESGKLEESKAILDVVKPTNESSEIQMEVDSTPETGDNKKSVDAEKTENKSETEEMQVEGEKSEAHSTNLSTETNAKIENDEISMEVDQTETNPTDKVPTTSAVETVQPDNDSKQTQVNGKATNGDADMTDLNGDASKDDELSSRLSMENGKEIVNGANGDVIAEAKPENKVDDIKEVTDLKAKTVAMDGPPNDPIEQPTEA